MIIQTIFRRRSLPENEVLVGPPRRIPSHWKWLEIRLPQKKKKKRECQGRTMAKDDLAPCDRNIEPTVECTSGAQGSLAD
jgi:hypothetical protein